MPSSAKCDKASFMLPKQCTYLSFSPHRWCCLDFHSIEIFLNEMKFSLLLYAATGKQTQGTCCTFERDLNTGHSTDWATAAVASGLSNLYLPKIAKWNEMKPIGVPQNLNAASLNVSPHSLQIKSFFSALANFFFSPAFFSFRFGSSWLSNAESIAIHAHNSCHLSCMTW